MNTSKYNKIDILNKHLLPNETLLWFGEPKKGIKFKLFDLYLTIFSIFFILLSIFFFYISPDITAIIFIFFGFYTLFLRYFDDAIFRKNSIYAISNQRILIIYKYFKIKVISIDFKELNNLILKTKKDGSGSIYFGPKIYIFGNFIFPLFKMKTIPHFALIDNANKAYDIITEMLIKNENMKCNIYV